MTNQPPAAARVHPRELAYLGDAVFELHVRERLLERNLSQRARHREAVARVRATAQAAALRALDPTLGEDERDVVRRARNLRAPASRHVDQEAYRLATAFEALIGYRYLAGPPDRLRQLLAAADQAAEEGIRT
ncbi:MAG: ribonuclease III [Candidatus Sericytochromatia bacterium]|nr:ribonuclease III [Candidatus Tanganyikabacteria bacterium]